MGFYVVHTQLFRLHSLIRLAFIRFRLASYFRIDYSRLQIKVRQSKSSLHTHDIYPYSLSVYPNFQIVYISDRVYRISCQIFNFAMTSRASRFVRRVTRFIRSNSTRVARRRSRGDSPPVIPAVTISRSSVGRASVDMVTVGTQRASTQDVPAAGTPAANGVGDSDVGASVPTTDDAVAVDAATTPEGSVPSLTRAETPESQINILQGVEREWWYWEGKRCCSSALEQGGALQQLRDLQDICLQRLVSLGQRLRTPPGGDCYCLVSNHESQIFFVFMTS